MFYLLPLLILTFLFTDASFARGPVASEQLNLLYQKFDKDKDKKITLDDGLPSDANFKIKNDNLEVSATGLYQISTLAQELKLSEISGKKIDQSIILENPVDRISRSIRERFWDGLTRRIDSTTIKEVISDPKINSAKPILYIPYDDQIAFDHYKKSSVEVRKLPKTLPENFITSLGNNQGLLSLAIENGKGVPYVVPGGRFNEMYGWDSYFHLLGTLIDGRTDLAKGMVDNFVYQINHYGKILNANRTYYLTRSQPPFLTSMIRAVYEVLPKNEATQEWLSKSLSAAINEYQSVWMGKDRLTSTGLSRYAGFDSGIPPEVEPGHFNETLKPFASKHKMELDELIRKFNQGEIKDPELTEFFHQDRAVRESGHDTTFRWRVNGKDRASDFVTIDLNSLLYKYELDIAYLIKNHFKDNFYGQKSETFYSAAKKRGELIRKYLWNKDKKMFFDYNWKDQKQSDYISATTFYPLWASDDLLSKEEAKQMLKQALSELEQPGGISATAKSSQLKLGKLEDERQWEYPNGWAPHQILTWYGLDKFKLHKDKNRLIYKWLYMITRNAMDYNGTIPEKYDVVSRSHKVFSEYGNVGTKFSYITMEGFGWMNASYQIGLKMLPQKQLELLKKLTPPDKVNFNE